MCSKPLAGYSGAFVLLWLLAVFTASGQYIASGGLHNCAVLVPGKVKCWGKGGDGQLGLGSADNYGDAPNEMGTALPFVDLGTNVLVEAIFAGTRHNCVKIKAQGIKCWGRNPGALGYGDIKARGLNPNEMGNNLPYVQLGTGFTAIQLSLGNSHSCALFSNARVKCWGSNQFGQLGYEDRNARGDEPGEMGNNLPFVDLGEGHTVLQIASGDHHTCAVLNSQQLKCWGSNSAGQLGYGDKLNRGVGPNEMGDNLPYVDVGRGRRVIQVETNGAGTCVVLDNDSVKCWGSNRIGQLGLGDKVDRGGSPRQMGDDLPAIDLRSNFFVERVVMGAVHACALSTRRLLKCWGSGFSGQLGYENRLIRGDQPGEMGDKLPFVDLGANRTILDIDAASTNEHNCVILDRGEIKCWGKNILGTLGYGDTRLRGGARGDMGENLPPVALGARSLTPELPIIPSVSPTSKPTKTPTRTPTLGPTLLPTKTPSVSPTSFPTRLPTTLPTSSPTLTPTRSPTSLGVVIPRNKTMAPALNPTVAPIQAKTQAPTLVPPLVENESEMSWEEIASYAFLCVGVLAFFSSPGEALMKPLMICISWVMARSRCCNSFKVKKRESSTMKVTSPDRRDLVSALVFGVCDTCSDAVFVVSLSGDEQLDFVFFTSLITLVFFFLCNLFGSFALASDLTSKQAIEPSDAYIMALFSSFSTVRAMLLAAKKEQRNKYPRTLRASMISDLIEDIIQAMLGVLTFLYVLTKRNEVDSVALVSVMLSILSVGFVVFNLCSDFQPPQHKKDADRPLPTSGTPTANASNQGDTRPTTSASTEASEGGDQGYSASEDAVTRS